MKDITFQPKWASAPGETILDILNERLISTEKFATDIDLSTDTAIGLLNGSVIIDTKIARKLEATLGATSSFWLKREEDFQNDLIYLKNLEEKAWVDKLPIAEMLRLGWIKNTGDILSECLNYFNVPTVRAWEAKYADILGKVYYRKSQTFKSEDIATAAWIRQGELKAENIDCKPWDEELFEETLLKIKPLTREKNPQVFIPKLIDFCSQSGVAVVISRTPTQCKASGATIFSPEKAILMLSFRYLSDDQFWFTFYHEAGHILLHRDKTIFVEESNVRDESQDEKDANYFAGEMLIPHQLHNQLRNLRGKRQIIEFAKQAGISPGIVVGQMQHLGYTDKKFLNAYKRRYNWEDIEGN